MSLGNDLASIRKSQNLALEDIQNATKIPVGTLKNIENGRIFSDPNESNTYVRSFVRSYAKALKIDEEDIIKALDELDQGIYSGSLLAGTGSVGGKEEVPKTPETDTFAGPRREDKQDHEPDKPPAEKVPVSPKKEIPERTPPPDFDSSDKINWADLGHKYSPAGKNSKLWVIVILIVLLAGLAGTGYYFSDEISSLFGFGDPAEVNENAANDGNAEVIPPAPIDSSQVNQESNVEEQNMDRGTGEQSPAVSGMDVLGDTLSVTVYAAYGQLEPVRVTSDFNWQTNPFWMEQGRAYRFDFRDTLLVRGQYSRLLLLFNGHVVENPRQNYFDNSYNSIMITRSVLNQEQYLAAPPNTFPLEVGPPDTVMYRIRF